MAGESPFWVVVIAVAFFTAFGVLISHTRLRKEKNGLISLSLSEISVSFALVGYNFVAELYYLVVLFVNPSDFLHRLATVVLCSRILNSFIGEILLS